MNASEIAPYVGFAQRKGAVLYGMERITEKRARPLVVLVDAAAPEKFRAKMKAECTSAPCFEVVDLPLATHRDNVKAIAVTDASLAAAIVNLMR